MFVNGSTLRARYEGEGDVVCRERTGRENMCFCETNPNRSFEDRSINAKAPVGYDFEAHLMIRVRFHNMDDRQQH